MERFKFFPKNMLNKDTILYYLKEDERCIYYVPKELLNEDLCLEIINRGLIDYKNFPEECLTENVYLKLIELKLIEYKEDIPYYFLTEKVCLKLLDIKKIEYKDIPKDCLTPYIYLKLVNYKQIEFKDLPLSFLKKDLHLSFFKKENKNIEISGEDWLGEKNYDYLTKDLDLKIKKLKRVKFEDMSEEEITLEICVKYFYLDNKIINKIPKKFLNEEFYGEILNLDIGNIRFIHYQTLEMVKRFFLSYDAQIEFEDINLNINLVNKIPLKIFFSSVRRNGLMIFYVPEKFRTQKLYLDALSNTDKKITILYHYNHKKKLITFKFLKLVFKDKNNLNKAKYKKNLSYYHF
jgi:hypothetical protein